MIEDLLTQLERVKHKSKQVEYHLRSLYQEQWNQQVTNGYQKWRFEENGGKKLVREQLQILNYKCPVCGEQINEHQATIDHLQPKSKYLGQATKTENMLVMCHSCNACKRDTELLNWIVTRPPHWQRRFYSSIEKVHGKIKLFQLKPISQKKKNI